MVTDRKQLLRLVRRALDERSQLLRIPDVLGYAVGFREKRGERTDEVVLAVHVRKGRKRKDPSHFPRHQRIPREIRLRIRGETIHIGVDLIESEVGRLCETGPGVPIPGTIVSGLSVGNRRSTTNTGTIGWIARHRSTGEIVICGSFHIFLRLPASAPGKRKCRVTYAYPGTDPEYVTSPSRQDGGDVNQSKIGTIRAGERSQLVDVAVASLLPGRQASPGFYPGGHLGRPRFLREDELDPNNPIKVRINGRTSGEKEGVILEYPAHHPFCYKDWPEGLMMIDLIATDIPTQAGDSGCLLVDTTLRPLGMLIGRAGSHWSYFMHIRNIIQAMDLESV